MAKISAINKNNSRIKLTDKFYKKRLSLKKKNYGQKITIRREV